MIVLWLAAGALAGSFLSTWIAAFVCLPKSAASDADHWTIRARQIYPLWVLLAVAPIFLPLVIWMMLVLEANAGASLVHSLVVCFSSWAGISLAASAIESRVRGRRISVASWWRGWSVSLLFFLPHIAIFTLMAAGLSARIDPSTLMLMGFAVSLAVVMFCGGSLIVARAIGLLRAPSDRLRSIVRTAAERTGTSPNQIYELRWKSANAFAFPIAQAIAVSERALEDLTDDELISVCVHELAHLRESWAVKLGRMIGHLALVPLFLVVPLLEEFGIAAVIFIVSCVFMALRFPQWLAYRMELRADAQALEKQGDDGTYARALAKLYESNLMPAVMRQKHLTHPHLYDRLLAAKVTPDYPRPGPPSGWRQFFGVTVLLLTACATSIGWRFLMRLIPGP